MFHATSCLRASRVRRSSLRAAGHRVAVVLAASAVVVTGLSAPASASTVTSAVFTGGTGTVVAGGTLYARAGAPLTLTVVTSDDTKCVEVTGPPTLPRQTSKTAKTNWTFTTTAPSGDGGRAFTVWASPDFNPQEHCTGQTRSNQASYVLDNTGPAVAATLTPAANAAGWNNSDTTVSWTATDAGSGVAGTQPFRTDPVSADGIVTLTAPAQSDRLGNTGAAGSVTVRVDKAAPEITADQTRNADGTTTVTFTCSDATSGVATCLAEGSATNSRTVQPGVTVTGTATDKAGNSRTTSSTAPEADTSAPTLSGTPTTGPNAAGWYGGDVTVHWTAADPESGVADQPADTTISGEGAGLTSTATVVNGEGLSTTATSSPAVRIDRTPPVTSLVGASDGWHDGEVALELVATDALSGVASTSYTVDDGATQTGTNFALSSEGVHTVTWWSTDRAGNTEQVRTAQVRIDRTAPTISHSFTPSAYDDGAWTNADVTVTFDCADQGGSGLTGCTPPETRTAEGTHTVTGTATDGAGNTTHDDAVVRIDKTAPTLVGAADREPNDAGWYRAPVTVTWTADDDRSGIASAAEPVVLGQGHDQTATGTATDAAGNSTTDRVEGIDVDLTDPVLTGSFEPGWHIGDVVVRWTCTDELSGPAGQPADSVVEGEGRNLSATASCTDVAGNTTTETVTGIRIDRTAPTTQAHVAAPNDAGWYAEPAEVTLEGADNLSETVTTRYRVDGGDATPYDGPFTVGADGEHTVEFWSTDAAGNTETAGAPLVLRIDRTAPQTTVIDPISPDSGWFVTSGIPVAFHSQDGGSGIAATYYSIDGGERQTYGEPFTAELATGRHTITYWSVDLAGNVEAHATTNTVPVAVDTDAPTISGAVSPEANGFGWHNTPVSVSFTCDDVGSGLQTGVAGCAGDTVLSNDGEGQTVRGDAVDVAGNRSSTEVGPVNLDRTRPTLTGTPTTDPSSAAGWYRDDVTVAWTGVDTLSGIDPATQPAPSVVSGEGRGLTAGPATVADRAGNVSEPATVTGLKIDRTGPTVRGVLPAGRNAAGWYRGDVVVGFVCADPRLADGTDGSGVAGCPSDVVLKGDGADQSVTSAPATDVAGNEVPGVTVEDIDIDGHEPQTTADNRCTATNGWCTGSTATVVLSATDVGPSGVQEVHWTVNGGAEHVAPGASATVVVPTDGSGHATVSYWAVDRAGNVERTNRVGIDHDNIAPTVTHTVNPAANAADWNNTDVTVHFDARDTDPGSGVDPASVTPDVVLTQETNGTVVNGGATDVAGNRGTDSVTVRIDKTAPRVAGSIVPGTRLVEGWYTGTVRVHFTCSDELSGVAVCPDDVTMTSNGAGQSVTRTATDLAGNTASATVDGISIDNEAPTVTSVNVANASYTLGSVPAATCAATDSFSGVASCRVTVTGGNANGVGTFTYTAVAEDRAGNTSTPVTGTYRVTYRFDGFLQPINDTAHQTGATTSVFKAGSTVPVKLQLRNANGAIVQPATAPVWLTPVKGSSMSAPVDESVYAASADSGSTYRYDASAQQHHYNWKTGAGGNYWRIGVRLDDGQTYFVNIGLR